MKGKEILYFILLVLIVGVGVFAIAQFKAGWDARHKVEQMTQNAEATSGITLDGAAADAKRQERDDNIKGARDNFERNYDKEVGNVPEIADRAVRAVPDTRLREFRARRIARERSGCAGDQCRARSAADDSAER